MGYGGYLLGLLFLLPIFGEAYSNNTSPLAIPISVSTSGGRNIPQNFFGVFLEDIAHGVTGGIWAELVANRGFEYGGRHAPSMITPWGRIGDDRSIFIVTELVSPFKNNPVALRMDVLCDHNCPPGGVGVFNPGYWGMNIEDGKAYKLVFFVKATDSLKLTVSLTSSDGSHVLASENVEADAAKVEKWTRVELTLNAQGSDPNARLQLTSNKKGTIWLDQVSAMPIDTFRGHGFRKDMVQMVTDLRPRFIRFPGGCFVEGNWLRNAFRWKKTIGPWEERPGHMGDVWNYWSDDGLGFLEYLQLAEDIGAEPIWVINNGIAHRDEVDSSLIDPFVQEMLDSIEFARGSPKSTWGSLRAKYGHPQPFNLQYVAIGNEDCMKWNYRGNYIKFYDALKREYPDIKVISNCDETPSQPLAQPTDIYDFHIYTTIEGIIGNIRTFENKPPGGPKAFVSEYGVTEPRDKIANGTFLGALAEAIFLLSLEKNSDAVEMVCYGTLFGNLNDLYFPWAPFAMFFNSHQIYAISSYWVQTFFSDSSGAILLKTTDIQPVPNVLVFYSAIKFTDPKDRKTYIRIKVVNFQEGVANIRLTLDGVDAKNMQGVRKTVLTSPNVWQDNSIDNRRMIIPQTIQWQARGITVDLQVDPFSLTAFDYLLIKN
ncbi:hypothetical protein vseg_003613 [Gypsophila vaccaria]